MKNPWERKKISEEDSWKKEEIIFILLVLIILVLPFIGSQIGNKLNFITGFAVEQVYNFGIPKIDNEPVIDNEATLNVDLEEVIASTTITTLKLEGGLFETSGFFIQAADSFNDDFNRADSTNLGTNWTEVTGDLNITTNRVRTNFTGGRSIALLNYSSFLGIHNSTQTANCIPFDVAASCGLIARYENESNYYLLAAIENGAGIILNLTKRVTNVTTVLNVSSGNPSTIGKISLSINGTNISTYSNTGLEFSIIDTDLQNDTSFVGISLFRTSGGPDSTSLDSYNISSDTAATTSSTSTTTLPRANLTLYLTNSSFTGLYQNITAFTNDSVNITSKEPYPADVNMTLYVTNYVGVNVSFNYSKSFLQNITTFWTTGDYLINITWEGNLTIQPNSTAFYVTVLATSTTSSTSSSTTSTSSSTSTTTASSGTGSSGGEGGGGTIIPETPAPVPSVRVLPPISEPAVPIPPLVIRPKPIGTIYDFYDRIKATKEEKTILKTLEEKIKVGAYPDKVSNILVIRFRNTLFIPIEDFLFIINLEKPSFNIKVLGNNNLIKKEIVKEINKIANEEIKKAKEEYSKIIKQINEEYKKKINELKKTIKDKVLLNYKIKELTKERDKKLKEEKERLNKKIRELLDERDKVIKELKKLELPVICPPLEIHPDDWCKDGKIVPGKKDANGCKLKDKCVKCPVWPPKQCKGGGKLVPGGFDQNGCKAPDRCIIDGVTTTSTSSTSTSTSTTTTSSSTSTSSTTIPGLIITTTTTSTSSSTSTISGIGIMIIESETGRKVNETILYFSDIIVESDRTNITIEELGIIEYDESLLEKASGKVDYEGIYNLVLFLIIILILLYLLYRREKKKGDLIEN